MRYFVLTRKVPIPALEDEKSIMAHNMDVEMVLLFEFVCLQVKASASPTFEFVDNLLETAELTETDNICKALIYIYAKQDRGYYSV